MEFSHFNFFQNSVHNAIGTLQTFFNLFYFIELRYKGRVPATPYTNYSWPALLNPPCPLSLWEETRVPGEKLRLSAER